MCCARGPIEEFRRALVKARAADRTTLVYIETDPLLGAPSSDAWWDVPVAEVADAGQHPGRPGQLREGQAAAAALPVGGARSVARSA